MTEQNIKDNEAKVMGTASTKNRKCMQTLLCPYSQHIQFPLQAAILLFKFRGAFFFGRKAFSK